MIIRSEYAKRGEFLPYYYYLRTKFCETAVILHDFYNKKDKGIWKGCFGAMSIVTYNYLKGIDHEFRISSLIPHIISRDLRCAFERIIACLLQVNVMETSLFGDIFKYFP